MIAYVIQCNENVRAVVLDNKLRADELLKELQEAVNAKLLKDNGGRASSLYLDFVARHRWRITAHEC